MALEWGPATKGAAERQAKAIKEAASEPRHFRLAERAETGEFTDYSDAHACPITELHRLCRQYGLHSDVDLAYYFYLMATWHHAATCGERLVTS